MPAPTRSAAFAALLLLAGAPMTAHAEPVHEPNKLANETSPYLLQHAHNPVEWHPWGPEAFEEARRRNVPIFLSVGYSTCYWCHVMERESFENEGIAALMNEHFVCIKVDREERPDVDEIYMAATQMIAGRGGWPMSVWMTPPGAESEDDPGLKPFFAGTYYPPVPRDGMNSFPELIENISDIWSRTPEQIIEQADRIAGAVRERFEADETPARIDSTQIQQALVTLVNLYDREHAGFGGAPKFPQPTNSEYLFEVRDTITDPALRGTIQGIIKQTLDNMATGGMYDQVGGGFHRYSTDAMWLVPHFEKMLYDNGQLASLYALSAAVTGDEFHARVCADILGYVLREMTSESGAFYSAQDAEVDSREGLNYLWTEAQIREALTEAQASFAIRVFGVDRGTNFQDPHHPQDAPKNVLFLTARPEKLAEEMGMDIGAFLSELNTVRAAMYRVRQTREQPGLDDKVITSWNGLMIKGFADGAIALRNKAFLDAGSRAADDLYATMYTGGVLARTARNGTRGPDGVLEDYAFFASGLLALHRTSAAFGQGNPEHVKRARAIIDAAYERFGDPETGTLYDTPPGQSDLFVRTRSTYDGAIPSAPSVMLHNLIDLYDITNDKRDLERAIALLGSMSRDIAGSPAGAINSVRALHRIMRLDASIPDRFGEPVETPRPAQEVDTPVQVLTQAERVTVPSAGSVDLPIRIEIEEPFHINAHEPGVAALEPLTIGISGGTGIEVRVDYPDGTPYAGSAVPDKLGTLMVHTGAVELTATISRTGEPITGRPLLVVTYQVCSDTECYRSLTVELDVALDAE